MTGVQTCALPIYLPVAVPEDLPDANSAFTLARFGNTEPLERLAAFTEIGRASCRERVFPVV